MSTARETMGTIMASKSTKSTRKNAALLIALVLALTSCSNQIKPPTKVMIVGIDAADWQVIDPLLEQGKLPNFAKLVARGCTGELESFWPLQKSPTIWTSIATGVIPEKHGIGGFVMPVEDRDSLPYTVNVRRVKAVWDILGAKGMKVGVVGWMVTWPAEEVNGYMVSDYVQYESEHGIKVERQTYPDALFDEIDRLRLQPTDVSDEEIKDLYPTGAPAGVAGVEDWKKDYVKMMYATDVTFERIALDLWRKGIDFLAVYFNGIDSICHNFWEARKVKDDPLNKVVDSYYIWTDGVLGEFMKLVDDQTLLIVCSDHGFQGAAHMPDGGVRLGIHMHRRYGMIGMVGRNVRKGARLSDAQVLDVTPTLLYALGYPVARDMDGRVLTEAFRPGFLEANPLQFISTYESGSRRAGKPIRSPVDDKVKQKLKALGYME